MIAVLLQDNVLYQLLFVVHILAIVAAFGPLFLYPRLQRAGETQAMAAMHMKLAFPALIVLWVAGMGMAGVGKFELGKMHWITITIVLWVISLAVSWFLIRPAVSDTSEDAKKKMSIGIGITHLIFTVSLILMVFKPFVDGYFKIKPS